MSVGFLCFGSLIVPYTVEVDICLLSFQHRFLFTLCPDSLNVPVQLQLQHLAVTALAYWLSSLPGHRDSLRDGKIMLQNYRELMQH